MGCGGAGSPVADDCVAVRMGLLLLLGRLLLLCSLVSPPMPTGIPGPTKTMHVGEWLTAVMNHMWA